MHSHCYRADEMLMLIRVADAFGFKIATFQHGLEAYKIAPEIAKHGAGVSTFSDWWAFKEEARDAIPYNGALCARAGIVTSFNSDSAELMRRFNVEAEKAIKYGGMHRDAALALVTINPAKQLGIDAKVGSIEVGKDGDLAVWSGEPLSVYSRCEWTIVDGKVGFQRADHPTALTADISPPEPASAPASAPADAPPTPAAPLVTAPIARAITDPFPAMGRFALVGATVYPVASDPIESGVVLVTDGRIEAVGKGLDVPAGFARIDCTGLRVYPGMIDSATSVGMSEIGMVRSTVDAREQGSLQGDLRAAIAVNPASDYIPVTRVNGITTVVVRPQGSLISGQSGLMHLSGWTWEQMALVDPLALHVSPPDIGRRRGRFGGGGGGGRFGGPPSADATAEQDRRTQELMDAFAAARAFDKTAKDAASRGVAPPAVDPRIAALVPYARGEKPVVFEADTEGAIEKSIDLAKRLEVRPIVSGGAEAWKVAGALKAADVPVLVGPVLTNPSQRHDPYDAAYANAAVLWKAGVRFAIQSGDSQFARNLPYNAGMAAAYGLPKDEALKAVTLYPAQIFGVDAAIGSIKPGAIADLVVADGDLLEASTQIVKVIISGRDVSTVSKHTALWEKYLQRLSPEPVIGAGGAGTPAGAGAGSGAGSTGSGSNSGQR